MSIVSLTALLLQTATQPLFPVTIEEYLKIRDIRAVQISPSGASVAFTVRSANLESGEYKTELYLWESTGKARKLTRGREDVSIPRWSPDGSWLAFLSKGAGDGAQTEQQLWLLPIGRGGEAIQLTALSGGVLDYGWSADSSVLVLTRESDPAVLRAKHAREFWSVLVPGGAARYIWGGDRGIATMAVSADGRKIVYSSNQTGAAGDYMGFDLWVLDLGDEEPRQLTSRPGPESSPIWSPDGNSIVFQAPQNPALFYSQTELFTVPASSGTPRSLTDAFDRSVIRHRWPEDGDLMFSAALGAYTPLFALRGSGAVERLTSGEINHTVFDAGPGPGGGGGGAIYAVRESSLEAPELWRVDGSEPHRLTELNSRTRRWKLGRQEVIRWTAADGLAVEGLLVYPADYEEGRRYPLLVNPHSGPSSRTRDVLHQFHGYQLFAAQGYAVLAPNFRGSTGYGESFGTANPQDLGGSDFTDLMGGVEQVVDLGIADSTRLGIYGGGYGGYMTSWAISQTRRFKAAISISGIFSFPRWEDIDGYVERSPMHFVADIQTPTLIIHGADESNEMYGALRDLRRSVHRPIELFFLQLRWFDRYLKFGGSERFEYYLVDEWVRGPAGWEMRAVSARPRARYVGMRPDSTARFLEVVIVFRRDADHPSNAKRFELDLGRDVGLVSTAGGTLKAAGTVTEIFGQKMLVAGAPGRISAQPAETGTPTALAVTLAFKIAAGAGRYMLQVAGFTPVRIWVPPAE